jgi:hypothetical protein
VKACSFVTFFCLHSGNRFFLRKKVHSSQKSGLKQM